jgi:hypothetical protein
VFSLRRHAKGEAGADYSCCNKVLRFHGHSYLTVVRPNLLKFYSLMFRVVPILESTNHKPTVISACAIYYSH